MPPRRMPHRFLRGPTGGARRTATTCSGERCRSHRARSGLRCSAGRSFGPQTRKPVHFAIRPGVDNHLLVGGEILHRQSVAGLVDTEHRGPNVVKRSEHHLIGSCTRLPSSIPVPSARNWSPTLIPAKLLCTASETRTELAHSARAPLGVALRTTGWVMFPGVGGWLGAAMVISILSGSNDFTTPSIPRVCHSRTSAS